MGRFLYSLVGTDFFKRQALVVTSGEVGAPLLGELKRAAAAGLSDSGLCRAGARHERAEHRAVARRRIGSRSSSSIAGRSTRSSSAAAWSAGIATCTALIAARSRGVEIVDLASVCERFLNRIPCDQITELWLLWGLMGRSSLYVTRLKRLVDFALALALLVLLSPLLLVIALLIRLFEPRAGALYAGTHRPAQPRVQRREVPLDGATAPRHESGPVWAAEGSAGDRHRPVVAAVAAGRAAPAVQRDQGRHEPGRAPPRAQRLRQRVPHGVPMYNQRHGLRPGITGWGQIHYDYAASREQSREKLEYDLFYVKNASFLLDLAILLRTTRTVVGVRGR